MELLYETAKIKEGDLANLIDSLKDSTASSNEIRQFIMEGQPARCNDVSIETRVLLHLYVRFLLDNGMGQHPSKKGCNQKAAAVIKAYDKELTAREEVKAELKEQIKAINEKIKQAAENTSWEEIEKELKEIFEKLKVLGPEVLTLPEYEKTLDAFEEAVADLGQKAGDLQDKVLALKAESVKIMAKQIEANIKTGLSLANHTAKVTVSWDKDEDADGYIFKVNGRETAYSAGKTAMTYSSNVSVGKKYTYEVTPYVNHVRDGNSSKVKGRTYKIAYVPKVTVATAKLTKVRKGKKSFTAKWKKVNGADGYQLSYKSGKRTKYQIVRSGSKTSLKVTKLKKHKKYTVKVRAYKTINNLKYYGSWSNAGKVVTK